MNYKGPRGGTSDARTTTAASKQEMKKENFNANMIQTAIFFLFNLNI